MTYKLSERVHSFRTVINNHFTKNYSYGDVKEIVSLAAEKDIKLYDLFSYTSSRHLVDSFKDIKSFMLWVLKEYPNTTIGEIGEIGEIKNEFKD